MAKKSDVAPTSCDYKPSVSLDIEMEDVSELKIGDKVTVKIQGKIVNLEMREKTEWCPTGASMRIEMSGTPKFDGENEFSDLADDDDE